MNLICHIIPVLSHNLYGFRLSINVPDNKRIDQTATIEVSMWVMAGDCFINNDIIIFDMNNRSKYL